MTFCELGPTPQRISLTKFYWQGRYDLGRDLILQGNDNFQITVGAFRPQFLTLGITIQLGIDPNPIFRFSDITFGPIAPSLIVKGLYRGVQNVVHSQEDSI